MGYPLQKFWWVENKHPIHPKYPVAAFGLKMGLSERKSVQKISEDPRNTRWAMDNQGKGYQMLARMGWDGSSKGLTATAPVQSKILSRIPVAKDDTMGIGASKINTGALFSALGAKALTFVTGGSAEQQRHLKTEGNDFSSLLARLNSSSNSPATSRDTSVEPKQAVHRNPSRAKHLKAKRMAATSNPEDLAGIMGVSYPIVPAATAQLPSAPTANPVKAQDKVDTVAEQTEAAPDPISTEKTKKRSRKEEDRAQEATLEVVDEANVDKKRKKKRKEQPGEAESKSKKSSKRTKTD